MKKTKILSVLLSLVMIITAISMMPVGSFAATPESEFSYTTGSDGTVTITKYNGSASNIEIPDTIAGKAVTAIGDEAFAENENLLSVTIPASVKSIGDYAFDVCCNLASIKFNEGLETIGGGAFELCVSITSIKFPNSLKTIYDGAFFACDGLDFVNIPASVTYVGNMAFGYSIIEDDTSDEGYSAVRWTDFVVCGRPGTTAQTYANSNSFEYRLFPDVVYGVWYTNAVLFNVEHNYFSGYGNGYFGPADNIQRQDFVVVLAKIANADLSAYAGQNGGFADVPTNDYYSAAIAWAKNNKILSGYADGRFGVGDPITREQACVIFYNYCHGSVSGDVNTVLAGYPDGGNVSDWARTAVAWAAQNGVVGGNGTLNPVGNANRAEMAQIIMNMSNNDIL